MFILEPPLTQLSARIRDDRDKSNFVSAAQARKSVPIFSLEIFFSPLRPFFASLALPLPPSRFSPVKILLEVRIETERGIKDETTRAAPSLERAPPRNSRILSIRHESLFGRPQ